MEYFVQEGPYDVTFLMKLWKFRINASRHQHIMMTDSRPISSNASRVPPPAPMLAAPQTNAPPVLQLNCHQCHARLTDLKRQALKYMMIEHHRIVSGQTQHAPESLLHVVYKHLRVSDKSALSQGMCCNCGVHVEFLKKHALLALQTANFAPFATPQQKELVHQEIGAREGTSSKGETSDSTLNGKRMSDVSTTRGEVREDSRQVPASPIAAQFFTEAAKKFNIPSKKKSSKKNSKFRNDENLFPTHFHVTLDRNSPPNPPGLFKYMGRRVDGKVSVMLRIAPGEEEESFISVDQRKKHVSIIQPKHLTDIPQRLQTTAPKLYAFDSIFEGPTPQTRVSASALLDVLHAVINGGDGCLLSYGAQGVGKTRTMVGQHDDQQQLGVIPCAIAWLYALIEDSKQRTGARISVRISAVEVVGKMESLKDLLAEQVSGGDSGDSSGASPGIYLREDPIGGTVQLSNVSEPQAVTAEKAAYLLDAALASRTHCKNGSVEFSHMIFTIHVYQYRVDKNYRRGPGGAVPYSGGRSRLHLIDLSCVNQQNFDPQANAPSHAGLGQIIVAMLNGFKQIPYRDAKITRLLKDSIGNPTCRATLIAHVSECERNYVKTCSTVQLAAKVNKSRRKKNPNINGGSASESSCDDSSKGRRPHPAMVKTYGIDDSCNVNSDYNTSSAGEDSCDTVIYMGNMSDRDFSDNEHPPSDAAFMEMKLKLASSSEDDEAKNERPLELLGYQSTNGPKRKAATKEEKPPVMPQRSLSVEKAVNVVAPLVINEKKQSSDEDDRLAKTPSDKEIRKQEKRIAKLLKNSLLDDPGSVLTKNRINDGYKSDTGNKISQICHKICKLDGYISAPENFKSKPVQVVRGTVRQPSVDEKTKLSDISEKNTSEQFELRFEDDTCEVKRLQDTNLDETNDTPPPLPPKVKRRQKSIETNVDEPFVENSVSNTMISSEAVTVRLDTSVDGPLDPRVSPCDEVPREYSGDPLPRQTSVDGPLLLPKESCVDGPLLENSLTDISATCDSRIENLEHVITVSTVPNFSVAKKPLHDIAATPKLDKHQIFADPSILTKLSREGLRCHELKQPAFERSYSREDTVSLVSVNDSDGYDSDASPAVYRRKPTRLRYRWSTVFEEEEKKIGKHIVNLESEPRSGRFSKKVIIPRQPMSCMSTSAIASPMSTSAIASHIVSPSPRANKKFSLLSPKSDRKLMNKTPVAVEIANRNSLCSDTSSGIGSSNSQSSSLRSAEQIKVVDDHHHREVAYESDASPSKTRLWPFRRSGKKSRRACGYMSDGNMTDSGVRYEGRRSRFFGSKSKASLYTTDGHCSSGYDTSITEGGTASCAEDNDMTRRKKKKRFLGFRRRSTTDLNSRRVKKPIWLDTSRRCQSDDEGMQLKVYQIDDPAALMRRCQSSQINEQYRRSEEVKKRKPLKAPTNDRYERRPFTDEQKRKAQKPVKNKTVTCFDVTSRKTTRI